MNTTFVLPAGCMRRFSMDHPVESCAVICAVAASDTPDVTIVNCACLSFCWYQSITVCALSLVEKLNAIRRWPSLVETTLEGVERGYCGIQPGMRPSSFWPDGV